MSKSSPHPATLVLLVVVVAGALMVPATASGSTEFVTVSSTADAPSELTPETVESFEQRAKASLVTADAASSNSKATTESAAAQSTSRTASTAQCSCLVSHDSLDMDIRWEIQGADQADLLGDADGDGVPYVEELEASTNPRLADTDGDGLDDGQELKGPTNPRVADTDGDGLSDLAERMQGSDPTAVDSDRDGLDDRREAELQTDPLAADTDGDGLRDRHELATMSSPLVADTDGDGLGDLVEVMGETNPRKADTDGDGLSDAREVEDLGTDPTAIDSDGDNLNDGMERRFGLDPTNGQSMIPLVFLGLTFVGSVLGAAVAVSNRSDRSRPTLGSAADRARNGVREFITEPTSLELVSIRNGVTGLAGKRPRDVVESIEARATSLTGSVADRAESPTVSTESESAQDFEPATPDSTMALIEIEDPELVPDEWIVEQLLEREGGQMKQGSIVRSTDWSKAKVSRVLSRMAESDEIVKVRLGRENLICLPGKEPAIARQREDVSPSG